ncbi:MAG: DsbE family thiol:disulfide interchange protein, partial [Aeromonas sp.]
PYQINLYDPDGMLGMDLGVYGAPETFFIDSKGIIRYRHVGDINPENWASTLKPIFDAMK